MEPLRSPSVDSEEFLADSNALYHCTWGSPRLRRLENVLLINLTLTNIGTSIASVMVIVGSFHGHWIFGHAGCYAYGIGFGASALASFNSMAAISIQMYREITCRLPRGQTGSKLRGVTTYLLVVWTNSFIWVIGPVFGWGRYILESTGTSCTFDFLTPTLKDTSFVLSLACFGFLLPLLMIVITNVRLFRHIHMVSSNLKKFKVDRFPTKSQKLVRIAQMTLSTVIVFVVPWLPYVIVAMIGVFGDKELLTPLVAGVPVLAAKTYPMFTPLLYITYHKELRSVLMRRIRRRRTARFPQRRSPVSRGDRINVIAIDLLPVTESRLTSCGPDEIMLSEF
ncbi:rhodopsin, GQ-coupled-like [Lingula anatina]|uniref:Rhodopsin, GQ-coupled-like n=1 Tax=Lingula anatina TaxID=7574 RepID=A0A2R2MSG7_LINAN|nr:rhodopsin, GQ-coupled-like [Lingula anatina]|eukprot:XP_023932942.1 rhodopsin, GQ-coupled-like [Lingula anatina]